MTERKAPKCADVFDVPGGVRTSSQAKAGLGLMIGDIVAKRITNSDANAVCNAIGKMAQLTKYEHQHGGSDGKGGRELELVGPSPASTGAALSA